MSEVMKFEIASEKGLVLETEGRYCMQNIKVVPKIQPLTIDKGGTYPVPEGYAGHGTVTVDLKLHSLTATKNGTYPVPEGYAGHGDVEVALELDTLNVDSNGTYEPAEGSSGFNKVVVNMPLFPVDRAIDTADLTTYIRESELNIPENSGYVLVVHKNTVNWEASFTTRDFGDGKGNVKVLAIKGSLKNEPQTFIVVGTECGMIARIVVTYSG